MGADCSGPKDMGKNKKKKNKKKPFAAAIDNLSLHKAGSNLKIPSSRRQGKSTVTLQET